MTIFGPAFAAELDAAGVTDRRFTWVPEGTIEYHPDVPDDQRNKVEAVLAAHDGPLSEARHQALEAVRAEAGERIAAKFGKSPDSFPLAWKEINRLARAVQIIDRKLERTALPEERLELQALDAGYDRIQAIRDTENKATAVLTEAKSVEEVEKLKAVEWPKE